MREDDLVVKQIPLGVKADGLASVPETGVNGKGAFLSHRRGKKQLTEVLSEDLDRFDVSLLLEFLQHFRGD